MFGDLSEIYIEAFEALLEDSSIEDLLEQEDLTLAEALYYLYKNGYIRSPFKAET